MLKLSRPVIEANEFEVVTDEEAYATIEAAWNAKIPDEFWADLKGQNLIEQSAPVRQTVASTVS